MFLSPFTNDGGEMFVDTVRRNMWIERRIACAGFCRVMSRMITTSGFGQFFKSIKLCVGQTASSLIEMSKRNIHLDDGSAQLY